MNGEAFERSHLPQALVSLEGVRAAANRAFAKLVGHEDAKNIDGVPSCPA